MMMVVTKKISSFSILLIIISFFHSCNEIERNCNLFKKGIIDPAKVTRCALKNAVSVAGTLLLTNHSIGPN